MAANDISRLKTISDLHRFNQLSAPEHPLISLIDYSKVRHTADTNELRWIQSFYTIGLKRDIIGKYRYGQQPYDFDEGLMTFFSPDQLISVELVDMANNSGKDPSGYILAVHPDFLFGSTLAKNIHKFDFFKYSVREALFLSEKEEETIKSIFQNIQSEYQGNIDRFSQQIIISQLELLLNYAERYYQRQFLTRKASNHQILNKLETLLNDYFDDSENEKEGLPTVQDVAQQLNFTSDYLSSMLKSLTGQTTQQHIHNKLIERAKVKLSTTTLSVSEIAYELGFEHSQSFSKLFKAKTKHTPLQFRSSFN